MPPVEIVGGIEETQDILSLLEETALFLWKEWPRDMQAVGHDIAGNFALKGVCPHCKRPSVFVKILSTVIGFAGTTPQGYQIQKWIAVLQCQGCRNYILALAKAQQNTTGYEYINHYPLRCAR